MKVSEMNSRQKKAYMNVVAASNWLIGGLVNTAMDNPKDSEEYKNAVECLNDHEYLVSELYSMATTEIYGDGFCCFNDFAASWLKDIRFCGKDWLMERCEKRITKMEKRGDLNF